jgi:uncharacterized membrane protein YraQ (UPF0718 family)
VTRLGEPPPAGYPVAADPTGERVALIPVIATGAALVATAFVVGGMISGGVGEDRLHQWFTVFLALVLQALPFLVLGTVLAGVVSAYLKPALVTRLVPRNPIAAVGVAGLAGAALPGCECSSVPLARRLAARGVPTPAALSFLLAAPAVNPVVVVATLVAFPGRPEMALARWLAALATSMTVGLLWTRWGRPLPVPPPADGVRPWRVLLHTVVDDTSSSVGYLAVGAAAGATLTVLVPRDWINALAGLGLLSILATATLAVLLAVCSEADAFLAAALRAFSPTAQLAFMVVGPVVDLKLIALQTGTFGPAVARRLAPMAFGVAVLSAIVIGAMLL